MAHKKGKINKEDLNSDKNYNASEAYAQSKLANVLFTKELVNKLQGKFFSYKNIARCYKKEIYNIH